MGTVRRRRKPNAFLGFLKAVGMLFALLFLLPVWFIRAVAARVRFRRELMAAGVPEDAAWSLSDRYKIRLKDLAQFKPVVRISH